MSITAPTYIYPPLDSNPQTLYQGFVTFMQANIPGWQPYSGQLDDWLARAFAGIEASLTEIASDVATSIYRYFGANIVNVPPYNAQAATGLITITVQDAAGYTIPAFTQFSFPDTSGNLQGFETTTATVIAPGASSIANVFVQAMTPGSAGNGCTGAGSLDSTGITYITALSMPVASSTGLDAEGDSDYLNRLTALFTTLTPTPITPTDFTIIAATQPGVGRAITLPTFNPANWTTSGTLNTTGGTANQVTVASTANIPVGAPVSGTGIPANTFVTGITSGTVFTMSANATVAGAETLTIGGQLNQGGYVTSWVADVNGAALTSGVMAAIQAAIQAQCLVNVNYAVEAPTQTTVNVVVTGCCWPGTVPATVEAAVQAALTTFLEPANFGQNSNQIASFGWLNDNYVRQIVLENVCMNVPGVHFISALTINGVAADLALGGIVPITSPGTITVTLTNG